MYAWEIVNDLSVETCSEIMKEELEHHVRIDPKNEKDCILSSRVIHRGNYARMQLSEKHLPEKYHERFRRNKAIFKVYIHQISLRSRGVLLKPYEDKFDTVHRCGQGRRPLKSHDDLDVCSFVSFRFVSYLT